MRKRLSFDDLYVGMFVTVATGETIGHNEHLVVMESTEGVVRQIHGGQFYVHWNEDPEDATLTSIHESDANKLFRSCD